MKNLIKISGLVLGISLVLGTSILAATGVVNAPNGLVLREAASKTANPLATLEDKEKVDIIEKDGEWYKIKYDSKEGYLFAEYVNVAEDLQEQEENKSTNEENNIQLKGILKVYNIPLITSTVISEINPDVEITIIKQITNWSYISTGDIQGWIRTYGISNNIETEVEEEQQEENEKPETESSIPEIEAEEQIEEVEEEPTYVEPSNNEQTETSATETKGFIAVDSATIRKEATTDSEVVTYLTKGTSFTIKAETEEWYKIRYIGIDETVYEGYIYKPLVTI